MIGKTFVDTNVLIYAHDLDAGPRRQRAAECLTELWNTRGGRLSTQVLQEFYVTVTQKIKVPLSRSAAREVVRNYTPWVESAITPDTVIRGSGGDGHPEQPRCQQHSRKSARYLDYLQS